MSNSYYNNTTGLERGAKVRSNDINSRMDLIEDGFDGVEVDIDANAVAIDALTPGNAATALYLVRRNADNTGYEHAEPEAGVGADTFKVRLESGSSEDYLGSLLGFGLAVSSGALKKTGQVEWTSVTTTHTAADGESLLVAGGATVTLPASPAAGATVRFSPGGDWEASNATVSRNSLKIMGASEDLTLNRNVGFSLVYKDATDGWRIA